MDRRDAPSSGAHRRPASLTVSNTSNPDVLASIGLHWREPVRFRKSAGGHWQLGKVHAVSGDGSLAIFDADGAARNLRPERVEVRRPDRRGRLTWRCVAEVAVTWEQLGLFGDPGPR
jgi:hypothetical protein